MNFGPLNRDGGERRLNVAITRARCEVVVFTSLKADDINLSRTRARGAQDLKTFLDYAQRGPVALAQAVSLTSGDDFESPFEREVCERIRTLGYEVHTQVGCSGYRIDLAVVDPDEQGRYLLGIECDGANYHSAQTARDRDRLRESVLRGLGWKLHRVWSSDWWAAPDDCLAKIQSALEMAKAAPSESSPPPAPVVIPKAAAPEPARADTQRYAGAIQVEPERLLKYRPYNVKKGARDPQEFYWPSSNAKIQSLVEAVVRQEGPVHLDVVSRRVASHWGLNRLGQKIRERIDQAVRHAKVQCVAHGSSVFLWPSDYDPAQYRIFRVPGSGEDEQRSLDEIAPEELIAAATHVLAQQISLPESDLIRETALLLGFQRSGQTIQRAMRDAIHIANERGLMVQDESGRVRANAD